MNRKRADVPGAIPGARDSRPPIDVAAGLLFRHQRLLITQRLPGDHLGGLWEFPGGKREPAETFEECLRRELMEELGVEIAVQELFDSMTYVYPDKTVRLNFYRCRLEHHEPRALGCQALAWVKLAQLADYRFPPADEQLLRKLRGSPELWR